MKEQVRAAALRCLQLRKENPPARVSNQSLYAGQPMYYYCEICNWVAGMVRNRADVLLVQVCFDCSWMIEQGYIEVRAR